ncbi:hypothetical protein FACS189419_02790 [Planctomycetales bacterium]|nr:hypothetical protein FACS189419_02790 [Planctomycetales bacterium]
MYFFESDDYWAVFSEAGEILEPIAGQETEFLSPESAVLWRSIRAENYRRSWLAARICAATLWSRCINGTAHPPWNEVNIVSRNAEGKGCRPVFYFQNAALDRDISLAHVDGAVLAVLAKRSGYRVGCDLVPLGSISSATERFFFHEDETGFGANNGDKIWAVKEAAYKAGNENTPFAPRNWRVSSGQDGTFCCKNGEDSVPVQTFRHGKYVIAVAAVTQNCCPQK